MAQRLSFEERARVDAMTTVDVSVAEAAWRLGRHRSTIYRELDRGRGPGGEARKGALEAGQGRAGMAVALGPSESAFRALADAVSQQCHPALYRGGSVRDETSVTDYELHVHAAEIGEGDRRADWSCLVRVDNAGARPVSWELLSCLEYAEGGARRRHPASVTDSEAAATKAFEEIVEERNRVLATWRARARQHLERLPNDLSRNIDDRELRRARRQELQRAVEARIAELMDTTRVTPGDLRHVGWCRVIGAGVPPEPTEKDSEAVSMAHVRDLLNADGWGVTDVHTAGEGFDLLARRGHEQRCVEVKGVWGSASSRGVSLTGNEIVKAGLLGDDYWLYVVDECRSGGRLFAAYPNPAALFGDLARDVPAVRIAGSALAAARREVGGTGGRVHG